MDTERRSQVRRIEGLTLTALISFALAAPVPIARLLPTVVLHGWSIAVLAFIFIQLLLIRVRRPRWYGVWWVSGLLALASAITSSATASVAANLTVAIPLAGLWAFAPPVIKWLNTFRPAAVRMAIVAFLVVQCASCVVAVVQTMGIEVAGYSEVLGRSPGLATHPNLLGVMAAVAITIALGGWLSGNAPAASATVVIVNIVGLTLSGSTSAMIAGFLGILVVGAVNRVELWKLLAAVVCVSLLAVAALVLLPIGGRFRDPVERFLQVTGQTDQQATLFTRLDLIQEAWQSIVSDPFLGVGLTDRFAGVDSADTYVHNFPLRAWMQGGIFLFIAAMLILIVVGAQVISAVRNARSGSQSGVLLAVLGFSLTSTFFDSIYYWLPVVVAWGCLPNEGRACNEGSLVPEDQYG